MSWRASEGEVAHKASPHPQRTVSRDVGCLLVKFIMKLIKPIQRYLIPPHIACIVLPHWSNYKHKTQKKQITTKRDSSDAWSRLEHRCDNQQSQGSRFGGGAGQGKPQVSGVSG